MSRSQFVVTTLGPHVLKSEVWDTSEPLPIGFPMRAVLERTASGVRLRQLPGSSEEFTLKEGSPSKVIPLPWTIRDREASLMISAVQGLDAGAASERSTQKFIETREIGDARNIAFFLRALALVFGATLLGAVLTAVWPKGEVKPEEELIPPQFAKVLLSPALKSAATTAAAGQEGKGGSKVTSVAQVFRSQVVQKSAQKLIKGGAMALLSRSDLLSGAGAKVAVSNIFDAKSKLDRSQALSASDIKTQSVTVGAMGAEGQGQGNQAGVGYGKGSAASVDGQGSSFVSLDTRESSVEEGLSRDEIGRVIHSHLAEIRYCYESAMIRHATVEGKLMAAFTISGQGAVRSASVKDSTLNDPGLDQCVLSHLLKWRFPKPRGGGDVGVTYPFIFKKLGN